MTKLHGKITDVTLISCIKVEKGKGFPYSIPSVGSGADPGVQAVSPQVNISHSPGGRLALLSARPAVTSPAAEHHRPLAGTKLYCLVTEAHSCEQLAQGCYVPLPRVGFDKHVCTKTQTARLQAGRTSCSSVLSNSPVSAQFSSSSWRSDGNKKLLLITQFHTISSRFCLRSRSRHLEPQPHTTTVLRPFIRDHPGELVPEENFRTLWCKGDEQRQTHWPSSWAPLHPDQPVPTSTILWFFYRLDALPIAQPTVSKHLEVTYYPLSSICLS